MSTIPANPPAVIPTTSNPTEQPRERRVSFQLDSGKLVETVYSPTNGLQFWVQGKIEPDDHAQHGRLEIEPEYGLKTFAEQKIVGFPAFPAEYTSTANLIHEIRQFVARYADLPDEVLAIVSLYVLMTWVYDRFRAVPYLRFLGEPGTGKTRVLEVTSAISYKGLKMSGSITGAALFRTIDLVQGTIAVDEGDFKSSAEWSDITKVLNNGYAAGTPVIRCNKNTFEPECFRVFGPKIISTRSRFDDEATESRCLTFETSERPVSKHIPLQLPPAFDREALILRNKLLKWRFDNFLNIEAKENDLRDGLFARTAQIGASLMAVVPDESWKAKLLAFLHHMDEGRNESGEKGAIKRALQTLAAGGWKSATIKEISERVNQERSDLGLDPLSPKRIGLILRSLGYSPKRKNSGYFVPLAAGGENEVVPAFRLLPKSGEHAASEAVNV